MWFCTEWTSVRSQKKSGEKTHEACFLHTFKQHSFKEITKFPICDAVILDPSYVNTAITKFNW